MPKAVITRNSWETNITVIMQQHGHVLFLIASARSQWPMCDPSPEFNRIKVLCPLSNKEIKAANICPPEFVQVAVQSQRRSGLLVYIYT
jgi:hypothetical protein